MDILSGKLGKTPVAIPSQNFEAIAKCVIANVLYSSETRR